MLKGDKVYVVENYLVEELTAALVAGEVGLTVTFGAARTYGIVMPPGRFQLV